MKTTKELTRMINANIAQVNQLQTEASKLKISRCAELDKYEYLHEQIADINEDIKRLRKLCVFVELTTETVIRIMLDKLTNEVLRATNTARTAYSDKKMQREYLSDHDVMLKKQQIMELNFILER